MIYIFLFIIGAILGSFYNVVIHRLPEGKSIVNPPSHCPKCKKPIRWYDNIPILSYIFLRGRCRYCKERISPIYPFVETTSGLLLVFSYYKWPLVDALVMYVFFSMLLILSVIDWRTFILPDILNYSGIVFGFLTSFIRDSFSFYESLFGMIAGFFIPLLIYLYYVKVRKMEGLGFGDVKLLTFIGATTGVYGVLSAVLLGSFFGLLYAIPLIIKHRNLKFVVPFGPFLSLGCFVGLAFEDYIKILWRI